MFAFLKRLFEKPEDRWYREAKERSVPLKIVKGDSKEVRAEKKAARERVWREYDDKRESLQGDRIKSERDAWAREFFRKLSQDQDAIGYRVDVSGDPCEECRALVGIYEKSIRISISRHNRCNLMLSEIYSRNHGEEWKYPPDYPLTPRKK